MVVPLDSPQPVYVLPPLADIPDTDEDQPKPGLALVRVSTYLNGIALNFAEGSRNIEPS